MPCAYHRGLLYSSTVWGTLTMQSNHQVRGRMICTGFRKYNSDSVRPTVVGSAMGQEPRNLALPGHGQVQLGDLGPVSVSVATRLLNN